jgi:hypothetical protein
MVFLAPLTVDLTKDSVLPTFEVSLERRLAPFLSFGQRLAFCVGDPRSSVTALGKSRVACRQNNDHICGSNRRNYEVFVRLVTRLRHFAMALRARSRIHNKDSVSHQTFYHRCIVHAEDIGHRSQLKPLAMS